MHAQFWGRTLVSKSIRQAVVLILKYGGGYFRGIVLVEVLWKTVSGLLNCHFTLAIRFCDFLHRFRDGHRMGTATLEANPLQCLTSIREAVLHDIFLDLQNLYDALDWYICLETLVVYVVGPRVLRILRM